jgi:hypothetical protein
VQWRNRSILAAALLMSAAPVLADPFAQITDRRFRQDVEMMSAAGLIRGPVDVWPMAWAQIDKGLDAAHDGRQLAPYLAAAVARVEALSDLAQQRAVVDVRVNVTNSPAVARDFNNTAREDFDGAAKVDLTAGNFSANVGVHYANGQRGNDYDFSPVQVAYVMGNWALYGGYTQIWTGPGQDGALLFSNSARPFPKIGIKRLVPDRIDFPLLKWLGPLSFDFFVGILDEQRDYPNQAIIGTHIAFEPVRGLTLGFSRMQQLCGEGRPCDFHTILKSFIGAGNADNPTAGDEAAFFAQPGNQIAGWNISYQHMFGQVAGKVYVEAEAEDSQHIVLEQYSRMVGTTWTGPYGVKGASWQLGLEYANTVASELFQGTSLSSSGNRIYPWSMYQNTLYYNGFTYNRMPIGYWTDGDSHNYSFSAAITDNNNRRWYGSARHVLLNEFELGNPPIGVIYPTGTREGQTQTYHVSANSETFDIFTVGVLLPTSIGDVTLEARGQTDSPNTPGYKDRQAQVEIGYRARF